MNERQALYISTIAQEGGILAAAKKLHISQPSLSQMLKQIETELGVQLFDRSTQPLRPTCAGEHYLHAASVILNANEALAAELWEIRKEERGRLRLGISMQRGAQLLPRVLPGFFAAWPHIEFVLMESGSADLEQMLKDKRVDLVLASTAPTNTGLSYELLQKETIGLLAGNNSPLALSVPNGKMIDLMCVKNGPFVSLKRGHNIRTIQDTIFFKNGLHPRIILETDNLQTAVYVTIKSSYYLLCVSWHTDKCGHFYPLKGYVNDRHFYAITCQGQHLTRYALDFIERLRKAL